MKADSVAFVAAQLGISVEALAMRRAALPAKFFPDEWDGPECATCDGTGLGQTECNSCYACGGSGQKCLPQHYYDND